MGAPLRRRARNWALQSGRGVVAASLTACGIRGPLYLPEEAPPPEPVSDAPDAPAGEAAEEEVGEDAGEDGDEAER